MVEFCVYKRNITSSPTERSMNMAKKMYKATRMDDGVYEYLGYGATIQRTSTHMGDLWVVYDHKIGYPHSGVAWEMQFRTLKEAKKWTEENIVQHRRFNVESINSPDAFAVENPPRIEDMLAAIASSGRKMAAVKREMMRSRSPRASRGPRMR